MSEDIVTSELATALAKAQGEFSVPKKTKQYLIQGKPIKYADLADIYEAVRKPLAANGLSIIHRVGFDSQGLFGLTTVLLHASAESISTWYPLPDISRQNVRAQEFGSSLTYARRYSVSLILGVAADDDDDGQGAAEIQKQETKKTIIKPIVEAEKKIFNGNELDSEYRLPYGPHQGKLLAQMSIEGARGYLNTVVDSATEENRDLSPVDIDLCERLERHIRARGGQV